MNMRIRHRIVLLLSAIAAGAVPAVFAQKPATIEVDASQILAPVNRLIFGQNSEAADNARIFSSDVTDPNLIQKGEGFWNPSTGAPVPSVVMESKSVGMSVLRYPGGCLAHNFDWRKSVGPDAKKNGWLFGLDEYMALCGAIGALPLITVSDYALPAEQMPDYAASLVEYLNAPAGPAHPWAMKRKEWGHAAPYNAIWFELGNESMHGNHRVLPHRQFSAEQYAAYANATAAAMRKVDPRIKIGIVMVPGPGTDVNCDWNRTVVRLAGASADFIVIHMYAPRLPKTGAPQSVHMQAMMAAPQHVEQRLAEYHSMIRQLLGHDLPLAITEFNGALDDAADRLTYGDALECADLLRVFLKPEMNVALANYWNFLNGAFGMLRTTVGSATGEPETEEPALLLYKLWAQHFGSRLVRVDVESPLVEFSGAGSEEAAKGTNAEPRRQIQTLDLDQSSSLVGALWPRLLNVKIQLEHSHLTIHLDHLNHSIYPVLARFPRPSIDPGVPVEFTVSFDTRLTPDAGSDSAPMGIGLMDSRGWNQTHSGIGLDGITTEWKHFDGTYRLDLQTPGVDLTARIMAEGKNVTGTLDVRNLAVSDFVAAHSAAYPVLTGSASLSADGARLYLIVINKSATDSVAASLHLKGFSAAHAQYWEVNGPSLESTTGVTETARGAPLSLAGSGALDHVFPAHSMTAIEFSRQSRGLNAN
jgi:alpha-N-arabinofuranosidase